MKIEITPGLIITAVAMLIFYFRVAMLRGRKRRLMREEALKRRRDKSKDSKKAPLPQKDFFTPQYQVRSWALVGASVLLMLVGVIMYTAKWFPSAYQPYWWIAATAGVLLLTFSIE
ncbi:MAG: hypothetical protein HPY45_09585 [Anaerolineae bacterium]|nr:hypothetical protein [Anaerolineae bacterium]